MNTDPVNGIHASANHAVNPFTAFYDKLSVLQNDVLSGTHPRIKLHHLTVADSHPNATATSSSPSAVSAGATNGHLPEAQNNLVAANKPSSSKVYDPTASTPTASPYSPGRPFGAKPAHEIDPVLLQKSDGLIKAEINLKRQRIERALKDNAGVKKAHGTDTADFGVDTGDSSFDVAGILSQALEIVAHVSGLKVDSAHSPTESFDENSYYSSQANTWSTEDAGSNGEEGEVHDEFTQATPQRKRGKGNGSVHGKGGSILDALYAPLNDDEHRSFTICTGTSAQETRDNRREREESEYSPPEADDVPAIIPNRTHDAANAREFDRYEPQPSTYADTSRHPHSGSPRVSPPSINRPQQLSGPESPASRAGADSGSSGWQNGSPRGPARNVVNPRKRKNRPDSDKEARRASGKRIARSPEPIIKQEPVSPPPFTTHQEADPSHRPPPVSYPDEIEEVSPREFRRRVYYGDARPPPTYYVDDGLSPGYIRVRSPAPSFRMERDDVDLRRIASVQYARRPYSPVAAPIEPIRYASPGVRPVRAVSHYVDAPPQFGREPSVRAAGPRYIRPERSRSPPVHYAPEPPIRAASRLMSPALMAPPPIPTRPTIVYDKYGNEYYASAPLAPVYDVPPPREYERREYREYTHEPASAAALSAARRHMASVPPQRRAPDPYDPEDAFLMPPPPAPMRGSLGGEREAEYLPPAPEVRYRQREYSMRPVEREYVPTGTTRAYSMRPDARRPEYMEMPREYAPRREVSVVGGPRYAEEDAMGGGDRMGYRY